MEIFGFITVKIASIFTKGKGLMISFVPLNFSEMKKLKIIQISSSGYSQLFGLGLVEKGIRACNAIRNQEKGIWERSQKFQNEIRGKTVGFWGYRGIARETVSVKTIFHLLWIN